MLRVFSWGDLLLGAALGPNTMLSWDSLPTAIQGPTKPVVRSQDPLPRAGCLGTRRTCDVI